MSITRNNHYVPQWYQEGFFEPGRSSLAYVDLTPDRRVLADGRVIVQRGAWDETPTSMAFRQKDCKTKSFVVSNCHSADCLAANCMVLIAKVCSVNSTSAAARLCQS
jgi:hypothetical protein